ncbi:hypothetical protein AWRI1631_10980020 [Saccharomyces cerevisiae AWRI1631]|uniref:Uncharacterized protein n=1 Tax=Saccharomyces cerevisiae (strain AWRI1631) TaxID=545124 RepID=B5VTY8_YEAS6|nr:hypothetical protein AWRI1631_10980020 [Saccharomyces cerevisiae AWRI1631]
MIDFLSRNEGMIKLLNMFISSFLPFRLIEDPAFRELALLKNGCVKKGYTICRKTLVNRMESYYLVFQEEMQGILEKTSQLNLLLDIWTSVNGKSYLAILASFCPNLNVLDTSTFPENVVSRRNPNTHIIAFHDASLERHTSAYLKEIVIRTSADNKLQHKVASVTFDNASNNVKMVEMLDSDLTGEGVNEVGGIIKIRCLNHVLNLIFKKMMKHFEGENLMLVSRIDSLTTKLKNNVFLRTRFQQYTKKQYLFIAIRGLYPGTNSLTSF